ncbi:hypothetical protein AXW84_09965 [Hymenobacter sp. PAMC 26628]|nr:hypothetical protein AXW84_09965 [Hymenobacter sp. PAMC 26628]
MLGLLLLGATSARAQAPSNAPRPPPAEAAALPLAPLYAAAHDSLMRGVAQVYAQAEARAGYFAASHGSFGGLHRRVRTYARASGPLVKREVVKHKFGVELQKVSYYDATGRQVLAERYEGRQLTRLELWEYPSPRTQPSPPAAKWLLVRGDYLRHQFMSTPTHFTTHYYHNLRPSGEGL